MRGCVLAWGEYARFIALLDHGARYRHVSYRREHGDQSEQLRQRERPLEADARTRPKARPADRVKRDRIGAHLWIAASRLRLVGRAVGLGVGAGRREGAEGAEGETKQGAGDRGHLRLFLDARRSGDGASIGHASKPSRRRL